jgi:hypothetical protein
MFSLNGSHLRKDNLWPKFYFLKDIVKNLLCTSPKMSVNFQTYKPNLLLFRKATLPSLTLKNSLQINAKNQEAVTCSVNILFCNEDDFKVTNSTKFSYRTG